MPPHTHIHIRYSYHDIYEYTAAFSTNELIAWSRLCSTCMHINYNYLAPDNQLWSVAAAWAATVCIHVQRRWAKCILNKHRMHLWIWTLWLHTMMWTHALRSTMVTAKMTTDEPDNQYKHTDYTLHPFIQWEMCIHKEIIGLNKPFWFQMANIYM